MTHLRINLTTISVNLGPGSFTALAPPLKAAGVYTLCRAVEQMKRYRQMQGERDKLQTECCRLREQKDEFMNQCHQLRDKMGKVITVV